MKRLLVIMGVLLALGGTAYAIGVTGTVEVWEGYSYKNVYLAADNTVVKASPGVLAGILVNGGTMAAITVYDNTTCVGTTNKIATIASPVAGQVIPFGVIASTGICVNTADNTNITVIYK